MLGDQSDVLPMDEDDDEDYVPDSLKGFLEGFDKQMENDIQDIMNDTDYMEPHKPKDVPNPDAYDYENEEEDKAFFEKILSKETDEKLKADLMEGLHDDMPPPLADESADFMSPSVSDLSSVANPAADLTASAARKMAMEGMSPAGINLQSDFDQAQHRLQPVAEGSATTSESSPWRSLISSMNNPTTPSRDTSESLTSGSSSFVSGTSSSLAYSSVTSMTSGHQAKTTARRIETSTASTPTQQPPQQTPQGTAPPMKSPPTFQQPQRQTVQSNPPSMSPMQVAATPPPRTAQQQTSSADSNTDKASLLEAMKSWGTGAATPSPARRTTNSTPSSRARSPGIAMRPAASPPTRRPIPAEKGMVTKNEDHRAMSTEQHPKALAKIKPSPPRQRPSPPPPPKKDSSQQTSPPLKAEQAYPNTSTTSAPAPNAETTGMAPTPQFSPPAAQRTQATQRHREASPAPADKMIRKAPTPRFSPSPAQRRQASPSMRQASPSPAEKMIRKAPTPQFSPPAVQTNTASPRVRQASPAPDEKFMRKAPTPTFSPPRSQPPQKTRQPSPAPAEKNARKAPTPRFSPPRTRLATSPAPKTRDASPAPGEKMVRKAPTPRFSPARTRMTTSPAPKTREASPAPGEKMVRKAPTPRFSPARTRGTPPPPPPPKPAPEPIQVDPSLPHFMQQTASQVRKKSPLDIQRGSKLVVHRQAKKSDASSRRSKPHVPPTPEELSQNPSNVEDPNRPREVTVVRSPFAPQSRPAQPVMGTPPPSRPTDQMGQGRSPPTPQPLPSSTSSETPPPMVIHTQNMVIPDPPEIQHAVSNDSSMGIGLTASADSGTNVRTPPSAPTGHTHTKAPSISPRLLMETTSSLAKHEVQPALTVKVQQPKVHLDSHGRRELTSPDKMPSRLLQPTSASKARLTRETTSDISTLTSNPKRAKTTVGPVPSRLLKGTVASQVARALSPTDASKAAAAEREATKSRVRQRVEEEKKKQEERNKAMRERIRLRTLKQKEKRAKTAEVLNRAREKREKLERLERERVERIQRKIDEKEQKAKQLLSEKENRTAKIVTPRVKTTPRRTFTPTVPIAPTFATDSIVKRREPPKGTSDPPPLAICTDLLRKGLRAPSPTPDIRRSTSSVSSTGLTIPRGPRLSTSERHGDKHVATPMRDANEIPGWESGLRSVSSPMERPSKNSLTIPKPPKFQELHKREPVKSTAERETEEMEYYKTHPFKARPVKMNDLGSATRPTRLEPPRPLTVPVAFHLRTDDRIGKSREKAGDTKEEVQFKARPMPDFSSVRRTPLAGRTPPAQRGVTTPEPFKLRTDERATTHVTPSQTSKNDKHVFHARPMPNFNKSSPVVIPRNPSRKATPAEPERRSQFRALPMPDFGARGPPETITFNAASRDSEEDVRNMLPQFHARPMPNFEKSRSPRRSPGSSASPRRHIHSSPEPKQFHARPLPTSTTPSIPVRRRDPTKLRKSPDGSPSNKRQRPVSPKFQARPAPKFSRPSIAVKHRDPTKLRSPDAVKKVGDIGMVIRGGQTTQNAARSVVSTSTGSSRLTPAQRAAQKLDAKARVRDRMMGSKSKNEALKQSIADSRARVEELRAREALVSGTDSSTAINSILASESTTETTNRNRMTHHSLLSSSSEVTSASTMERTYEVHSNRESARVQRTTFASDTTRTTTSTDERPDARQSLFMASTSVSETTSGVSSATVNETSKDDLRVATELWPSSPDGVTPRTGHTGAVRSPADIATTVRDDDDEDSRRREDTMRMAYELQAQAEDELSFHGSIHSKERGTQNNSHMNFY